MCRLKIKEIIVVEGKDDISAVKKAVDAQVIMTNGYSLDKKSQDLIKKASTIGNIIILTDSDYAGETIRKRVEKIAGKQNCKHAFIPREQSTKDGDIGVENARPESIIEALTKARCVRSDKTDTFSIYDMMQNKLQGGENASLKRDYIGKFLGIGYSNAKQFLYRLNNFEITREEFELALQKYEEEDKNAN